ncbi:phenylalanine--tRNA ligase subunit beta [Candidatus Protochlamydia phocaeensis]|uniref:phenylalanine--tRNA ligase subunit beta n=1 Tax=Candidatus Protochlamydia phocaeensis TaxID=1414722 RepID=UPI0008388088|nr:phenylalanine--tRNA ligase subunit beta [Candidatus Protochlamydia phocaeensis]
MRIPLSWLKEYIDLTLSPGEIAKILTMAGLEVDGYETIGASFSGIVVGRVLEAEKHPNADKLTVATVTDGSQTYQVVCGAPNCRKGLKTAFALLGATLQDEGKEFKIKKTKIRGVESSGMLCSGAELGLSDEQDGIMELPEELPEGMSLSDIYADTIFEISLTPNLGHCASVIGVARELAAAIGSALRYPAISLKEAAQSVEESVQVEVVDKDACPRYTCCVIKDVKVGPSPDWLKQRLEKCGIRSVNNVVDVTNYVLLEMGHPLHAFDYDQIEGQRLLIKKAQEGEAFETLDGKVRALQSSHLMICDAKKPIAIAGVMGGMNSEVSEQTHHIALESAYFDPVSIRKTSKQLGLQTDASKRFERGTDPNQLTTSLNRAAMLIRELAGGHIQAGEIDIKAKDFPEAVIHCRLARINRMLGTFLSRGEVEDIFKRLGFGTHWDGQDRCAVRVPTYRVDLKEEIDLVEEVARLYGYDNIPRQGGAYHSSSLPPAPIYVFEKEVQARLIAEGLQEFLTCDLIGPSLINIVQDYSMPPESVVSVVNPTSIEQSILRTSLLPGLLQVVKYNIDHQNHHIGGFEIGRIHFKDGNQYKEQSVAGIILTGKSSPHHWDIKSHDYDFYDLKGIVENIFNELGIPQPVFKNLGIETFHSGRQASVFVNSLEIGSIGEIHPAIQRRLDVSQRILFGEFNLHDLMQMAKRREKTEPLAIYPGSERDWTFTITDKVSFDVILDAIKSQQSQLLERVSLLDIYRSDKLSPGYQNMTLRFTYRDPSKTIAQDVVEAEHQRLLAEVVNRLGEALKS